MFVRQRTDVFDAVRDNSLSSSKGRTLPHHRHMTATGPGGKRPIRALPPATQGALNVFSKFNVIELRLDDSDVVLERFVAWSFPTRDEAVVRIENLMSLHNPSGYDATGDFWWGTAANGDRMRFLIEAEA
jgi:hypothetical protein